MSVYVGKVLFLSLNYRVLAFQRSNNIVYGQKKSTKKWILPGKTVYDIRLFSGFGHCKFENTSFAGAVAFCTCAFIPNIAVIFFYKFFAQD